MDLTTTYLGLSLSSPLVAGASPLSREEAGIRAIEDAGLAAVVLESLFEEDIPPAVVDKTLDELVPNPRPSVAPDRTPDAYLRALERAKAAVSIPVIGSLNGVTPGGWTRYAKLIEEAGADAIELNVYYLCTDLDITGAEVEESHLRVVEDVRRTVRIPVAVKLGPYYSALANLARRLDIAGADGLTLFNRFYQPDIDPEGPAVAPTLKLSTSQEALLPMRWIAILHGRVRASLAASTGIHTGADAVKMLLAGADVVQLASSLIRNGVSHAKVVREGLVRWMEQKGYQSVAEFRGIVSQRHCEEPLAYERANYIDVLRHGTPRWE